MAGPLRIGTRGSALALAQARAVAAAIQALGHEVELVTIVTAGDRGQPGRAGGGGAAGSRPRPATGGGSASGERFGRYSSETLTGASDKSRFVAEIDAALLAGEIDLAVHSAKDVPGELADGIEIAGVPPRADARDALCLAPHISPLEAPQASTDAGQQRAAAGGGTATAWDELGDRAAGSDEAARPSEDDAAAATARSKLGGAAADSRERARPSGGAGALAALPEGAVVGTASPRRRAQLLALRPDLEVRELRGNVDSRLGRLAEGNLDAVVLAMAGLTRLGRDEAGTPLAIAAAVPAAGQGCLALSVRADDGVARQLAGRLTDEAAAAALAAERALVVALGADCHTPVGAHATVLGDTLSIESFVGAPDGSTWIRDSTTAPIDDPAAAGRAAADRLLAAGAADILTAAHAT